MTELQKSNIRKHGHNILEEAMVWKDLILHGDFGEDNDEIQQLALKTVTNIARLTAITHKYTKSDF